MDSAPPLPYIQLSSVWGHSVWGQAQAPEQPSQVRSHTSIAAGREELSSRQDSKASYSTGFCLHGSTPSRTPFPVYKEPIGALGVPALAHARIKVLE
jgi:hypothetical protein